MVLARCIKVFAASVALLRRLRGHSVVRNRT